LFWENALVMDFFDREKREKRERSCGEGLDVSRQKIT
jgi:hypothetical protein